MKTLRRQKRKHALAEEIVFLLLFLLIILLAVYLNVTRKKGVTDWNKIDFQSDINKVFAVNVNPYLLGVYQLEENDDEVVAQWYVAQTPDGHFVGIRFENDDMEKAKKLCEVQAEYEPGKNSEEKWKDSLFEIQGWFNEMEEEELSCYKDALNWNQLSKEEQSLCLPYSITIKTEKDIRIENIVFAGFAVLVFGCWLSVWLKNHTLLGEKMIREYIKRSGNALYAKERISHFFNTAQVEPDFWIDDNYAAGLYEGDTIFMETQQLVWMYVMDSGVGVSGNVAAVIAVAATKSISPVNVMLVATDKKGYIVTLNGGRKSAEHLLEMVERNFPWIITEYTDELEHLYKKEWERFLDIAYYPNRKKE